MPIRDTLKLTRRISTEAASRRLRMLVVGFVLISIGSGIPAFADKKEEKAQLLVDRAKQTLDMFASDPQFTYYYDGYLKTAKGFLIIPSMAKGGFIVGGSKGKGALVARDAESGEWNGPAFYTLGSASIGLQAGGKSSEILMIVTSDRGINRLLNSGAKLGGDLSVAVGNLGEGLGSADVRADIIAFSKSKGFFGGASLEGSVIDVSQSRNRAYYGESLLASDILVRGQGENEGSLGLIESAIKIITIDHGGEPPVDSDD
jgi:lipid-binding SYLF domain-containing protein